jgi:hypothetical protein
VLLETVDTFFEGLDATDGAHPAARQRIFVQPLCH